LDFLSGWQDYLSGDPENRIVTQHYPIQATPDAFFSFDSSQILRFVAIKQKNPTTFVIGLSWSGWQDYLSGDPENRIVTQHYPIQATPDAFFSFDSSQILRFVAIKQKNPTTFVIGLSWSGWQN